MQVKTSEYKKKRGESGRENRENEREGGERGRGRTG